MANWKMPDPDRMHGSRGLDHDGDFDYDGNPASSPTTPFAFNGSPVRRSFCGRSQSLNGRIQKPSVRASVARSQSFNGRSAKLAHRSHHMDTLQAQLLYMKANGVDQKKFLNVLEKLKDMYLSQGKQEQQQQQDYHRTAMKPPSMPSSPLSSSHTFPQRVEDRPAGASTIALLQNKFAQLERYKESIQGQQIQLYPSQNFHSGHSSAQRTPVSSNPCSPSVGYDDSYYFDEGTAALVALQQEMMSNSSRSAAASKFSGEDSLNNAQASMRTNGNPWNSPESMGTCRSPLNSEESMGTYRSPLNSQEYMGTYRSPLNSHESMGSRSPGTWSACDSSDVSGSMSPQADEAASTALLHYMLRPPTVGQPHQNNLNAFQDMGLARGQAMGNGALGGTSTPESLGSFLAAERREILMAKKAAEVSNVPPETKLASSIQQVVAKFPLNLTAKFVSPRSKLQGAWGKSLSLNTPVVPTTLSDYSGDRSWESDSSASQTYSNSGQDVQWYNSSERECSNDMYVKQQELIDTSLHL